MPSGAELARLLFASPSISVCVRQKAAEQAPLYEKLAAVFACRCDGLIATDSAPLRGKAPLYIGLAMGPVVTGIGAIEARPI